MIKFKKGILNVVVWIAFFMTSAYTFITNISDSKTWFNYGMAGGLTAILEITAVIFIAEGLANRKLARWTRFGCVVFGVVLCAISVFNSWSQGVGEEIKKSNNMVKENIGYKTTESVIKIAESNVSSEDEQRKEIKERYASQIKEKTEDKNDVSASTVAGRNKRQSIQREIDAIKLRESNELNALANKNNESFGVIKNAASTPLLLSTESGSQTVFNALAGKTSLSKTNVWYELLKALMIQIILIWSAYLLAYYRNLEEFSSVEIEEIEPETTPPTKEKIPNNPPKESPNILGEKITVLKPRTSLGLKNYKAINHLKNTPKNLKNSEIKKYLKYMYETSKNDISQGYIKISKNIKMDQEKARKIKAWLEHEGIIETVNNRTVIIKKDIAV